MGARRLSGGGESFFGISELAAYLRHELERKKAILLYAYNGTGKTRLSMAFKQAGRQGDSKDTLYFNAFTEDMFHWNNDLAGDADRRLLINRESRFFRGLDELEMDNRIRPLLQRYVDFDFRIDTEEWCVRFSRTVVVKAGVEGGEKEDFVDNIKISRGEENIFIWCFFLAIVELVLDDVEAYRWVRYVYIDDPISSLDEHNAITVGSHLAKLLSRGGRELKTVVSSHHPLFFNVIYNELDTRKSKNVSAYFLSHSKIDGVYRLTYTSATPFFHHVALLVELCEAERTGQLFTYHFSMLRSVLEKSASFHGFSKFSACIPMDDMDDPDGVLHARIINILSHGNYSLFEPRPMLDENKMYFKKILNAFLKRYPFNPELFRWVSDDSAKGDA